MSIIDVCRKVARERKRENSVTICAKKQVIRATGFVEAVHGNIQGLVRCYQTQIETKHWHTAFSNFTCHSICNSLRWICALKIYSATRRQNPIPNICSELHMYHLGACLVNRGRDASSDEHLVATKTWFA